MRFRNLEPPFEPNSFSEVFRWAVLDRASGRRRRSPVKAHVSVGKPDLGLIGTERPSVTWVGHATWLVRVAGQSILTDPVWSNQLGPGISRNVAPGLTLEEARPDIVVVSHNHRDHLDAPTIERVKQAAYVVPEGLGAFFRKRGIEQVHELEWWESVQINGAQITFVPSQHWSQRGPLDRNESLWGGYLIEGGGAKVYFAGDTAWFGGFSEIGNRFPSIDAALLPIGAYDPEWFMRKQHMNPEDAIRAFQALRAKRLFAMHWGTFKLTDEPLLEPPEWLERLRIEVGIEQERVVVSAIGQSTPLV